jgi:type VI secretion system protein ImpA
MTLEPQAALEALLRPLPGPDPSGRLLQYDEVYDRIKEARRADDAAAPRDIWAKDLKAADWAEVRRLCEEALTSESKDLQLCAWLMEAWLHLEGLSGLKRGADLLLQMSESYWETVHPSIENGSDFRVAPFVWINEKLPFSLGLLHIVDPEGDPGREATWDDWKRALWLEKVSARRPQSPETLEQLESSLTTQEFRNRCSQTAEGFFRANLEAMDEAIEAIRALEAFLDDRLERESPSLVRFREAIQEIRVWTDVVLREGSFRPERLEDVEMAEARDIPADGSPPESAGPTGKAGGPLTGRDDAYRMLLTAARYLKEVEPHSPTPYLVLKAVAWGDKSLDDLLREFVRDGLNLEALFTFLGIEPEDEP